MILSIMYLIHFIYFKLCTIISHVLYVYQQKCYWFMLTYLLTYYITCLSCPIYVSGVTQEMYRQMVREEGQFYWQCTLCSIPNVEAPNNQHVANNTDVEAPNNQHVANNTDVEAPNNQHVANNTDVHTL